MQLLQGAGPGIGDFHLMSFFRQNHLQPFGDDDFVFHQQNLSSVIL